MFYSVPFAGSNQCISGMPKVTQQQSCHLTCAKLLPSYPTAPFAVASNVHLPERRARPWHVLTFLLFPPLFAIFPAAFPLLSNTFCLFSLSLLEAPAARTAITIMFTVTFTHCLREYYFGKTFPTSGNKSQLVQFFT